MFDISIFFIYRLLHYVKRLGIAPEILLEKAGMDLLNLSRFDSNIPERQYFAIMEEASAVLIQIFPSGSILPSWKRRSG
jgi:hypothetical protein